MFPKDYSLVIFGYNRLAYLLFSPVILFTRIWLFN